MSKNDRAVRAKGDSAIARDNAGTRIILVGDINLGGDIAARVGDATEATRLLAPFREVSAGADMVVGNLEGPLTPRAPYKERSMRLGNPLWAVDALANVGFTTLSLANNHLMDFGEEGLLETVNKANARIRGIGAGANVLQAREPAVLRCTNGLTVCVLAFSDVWGNPRQGPADEGTPGYYSMRDPGFSAWIDECVRQYDIVIAYAHWGFVGLNQPTPEQRELAHSLLSRGVKVVCASHCHHIQGYETTPRGLIAYGLGDLVMPRFFGNNLNVDLPWPNRLSLSLEIEVVGNAVASFNFTPWFFHRRRGLIRLRGGLGRAALAWARMLSRGYSAANYNAWFAKYNSRSPTALSRRLAKRLRSIVISKR